MNCSLSCLCAFLYLHSTAVVLSLPIHFFTLSFEWQTNLQNCNDFIVSLKFGFNFLLRVSCRFFWSLHTSFSSCKVFFSFCCISCNNCWNLSKDLKKQKIFLLTDKLLQANMAASSGLRENVYPVIFIAKILVYIILFYNYCIVVILA